MKRRINNGDSFESSRIISTNDIFLSTDASSSLSDKIEEQDEEINKLKKWTKWYVKYGGMGSGGGSGSGSGSSGSFGHKIYFKDSSMTVKELTGDTLNLWGQGDYTISFNLTKTQGHSFTVKYRINDGAWITRLIQEGSANLDVTLRLDVKVIFSYQIIDNTTGDETGEISKTIIPESFRVNPRLELRQGGTVQKNSAVNFSIITEGLCYRFAYTIYEAIEVFWEVRYKLETDSIWHTLDSGPFPYSNSGDNVSGIIEGNIDLSDVLDEETSVGKSITFELIYGMDRSTYTATPAGTTTISIIPLGYYILLTDVNEHLYLNQPSPSQYNNLNKLKKGYLPFYINLCSEWKTSLPVYVSIYNLVEDSWVKVGDTISSSLQTNTTYSLSDRYKITVVDPGLYRIVTSTNQAGTEYPTIKYFYVKEDASNWSFNHYEQISGRGSNHTYFADGLDSPMLNSPVTYYLDSFERDINTSTLSGNEYNYNIALGIQYDSSNDDNDPFIELSGNADRQILRVYRNKITYGNTKIIEDYYFPKIVGADETKTENWHLLNININFIRKTQSGQCFYEFTVYIDGVIEGVSKGIVDGSNSIALSYDYKFSKIEINPSKTQIIKLNLFDINLTSIPESIFFNKASIDNECYKKYNYLYDIYATTYYNRYRNHLGVDSIDIVDTSEFSKLIESFEFSEYGLPYTTSTTISDMITKKDANGSEKFLKVPILVLSPDETSSSSVGKGGFFKKWFLSPWKESPENPNEKPTSISGYIYYVPKDSEGQLSDFIIRDSNLNKIGFTFDIQGSSTKGFGIKNIELSINQREEDRLTVFTPNFDREDTSTFLPEKSFTLKADMVDSSTCNNNSIGDFINQNTKPLDENNCPARAANNPFKGHIKNCLTGFPVLVFINIDNPGEGNNDTFYYVGIYNFNLGRESYFNLGYYKNYSEFSSLISDPNQGEFKILDISTPSYADDLFVTEISNGDQYFDFSQYNASVLFSAQMDNPNGKPDDHSMFSYDDSIYSNQVKFKALFLGAVRSISKAGGYIFTQLQKNFEKIGNHDRMVNLLHDENGVSYNCVSDYRVQYNRVPYESEYSEILVQNPSATSDDLIDCIATTKIINDTSEPYTPYLDLRSTVEYYVICMAFGMVDSVLKNLEFKAWNTKKIFPAFYDMDTALGVDNNGNNVSFFAFSDYWENSTTDLGNGIVRANGVEIYPDFFNKNQGNKGYDVPSSYLFAIAKYATMDLMGVNSLIPYIGNTEAGSSSNAPLSPVNLYSLFRKKGGDLESASTFMSKYFVKRLENIPNSLKNLNYRAKYARVSNWLIDEFNCNDIIDAVNNTFIKVSDLSDLGKFNGTGVNKKTDWLNSRLHLLDSYFNINESVKYRVRKADLTKDNQGNITGVSWTDIIKSDGLSYWYYPQKTNINAIFGEDVTINNQMFYVLDGTKSTLSIQNLLVKAPSYTPVIIQVAGHSPISYLIGDSTGETSFQIPINTTGDQLWGIYGSKTFNYINNLGLFKLSDSSINSNNLKSVSYLPSSEIGNSKANNFTLNTPNIDSVTITGKNYGGSLTFDTRLTYNRLNTIDLSESSITCICTNQLPVTSLNLQKIDCSQNTISFANLTNLTEVFLDEGKFSKLELPFWKQSISITTNTSEIDATSGYDYHGVSIKTLNLINTKFSDSKLRLYDMPELTDVIVSDVHELYIYNCPKLKSITISESLKKISVIKCSTSSSVTKFSIGRNPSGNLGKLDFSICQNLTYLNMDQTLHFTIVDIGTNDVELPSYAFRNCTNLVYLDGSGDYILTGQNTFANDYSFTLRSSGGGYPNVICKDGLKNISYEFYCSNKSGSIDFEAAKQFLYLNQSKGVTNIDYLFYNQSKIGVSFDGFDSVNFEYLKKYTSITSASYSFAYCGINWWTKKLYDFGASSEVNIQGTFYCSTVNVQEDFLSNIGRKLTTYRDLDHNGASCSYTFYNSSGTILSEVTFYNVVKYLTNATTLYAFLSINNNKVNLKDCFRDTIKFTTIYGLLYSGSNWLNLIYDVTDPETEETITTSCYQCCSALKNVGASFSSTSNESGRISLLNLFTMSQWKTMTSIFTSGLPDNYSSQFSAGKTITSEEFDTLLGYLASNTSISTLGPIFKNCNITGCDSSPIINIGYKNNNTKTTLLYHTFNGLKAYKGDGTEYPIKLYEGFFQRLPNVSRILYAFANIWIGNENGLPFDFFRKRKENTTTGYYPNKEVISLETINRNTYEYIYYRSTNDSSDVIAPPNSSDPLKSVTTLISEDTNNIYYSEDANATDKWMSIIPDDHANSTSVRFLVSRRTKPSRTNSNYGNWESPRMFEKYEDSTNKILIHILDTTNYEYIYYSSTNLTDTILAPTEIGDGTLSLSDLVDTYTDVYTSDRTVNNKWMNSSPSSSTNYTKKRFLISRRIKTTISGETTYGTWEEPIVYDKFNEPLSVEVKYFTYPNTKLTDITGIFYRCRYTVPCWIYDYAKPGETSSFIEDNTSYIKDNSNNYYNIYYTTKDCSSTKVGSYRVGTEIDDLHDVVCSTQINVTVNGHQFVNFDLYHSSGSIPSDTYYPFIPSDFFLGVMNNCKIENAFSSGTTTSNSPAGSGYYTSLEGYIPKNLFGVNNIDSSVRVSPGSMYNWIENANILPVKIGNTKNYSFVPRNFIKRELSDIKYLFNFHIRVPAYSNSSEAIDEDNYVFYVMYSDSISVGSNQVSFNNTLPRYVLHGAQGAAVVESTSNNSRQDVCGGNYNFNYKLIVVPIEGRGELDGTEGRIDKYFPKASYEHFFSEDMLYVYSGTIWSDETILNNLNNKGVNVFDGVLTNSGGGHIGINKWCIFPVTNDVFTNKNMFAVSLNRINRNSIRGSNYESNWRGTYSGITFVS